MKKIFIVAIVLVVSFHIYCKITHGGDSRTPFSEFSERIKAAPMKEYQDPDFGYVVSYPCFFQKEDSLPDACRGYARFSFSGQANVVLESYVTENRSSDLLSCADSLAKILHAAKTMDESSFILSGPVYENGMRIDGYSHYDKFVKSGRMLFVYSLVYPDSYKPGMGRLFALIDHWKVVGAY